MRFVKALNRQEESLMFLCFRNRRAIGTPSAVLIALVLLSRCVAAQDSDSPQELTIVAFGDSTTALRSTVEEVYATRLATLLKDQGIQANVINSGVGGSHTGYLADNASHKQWHALDRFQAAVRDHHPHIVIVQFGWNDSWVDKGGDEAASRVSLDEYRENLRHIVTTLQNDGAKVILMTPNRPKATMAAWRVMRTEQYVQAVRKLAAESETPLVDVWKAYAEYEAVDGQAIDDLLVDEVHPGDGGHALVAEQLASHITTLVP